MNDGSINGGQAARPMLFEPLSIRGLTLKNRLVVPPMVHHRCDPRKYLRHISRRASRPLRARRFWARHIALHWAHDLGINSRFEDWSPEYGWWLEKRIRTLEGFATPTGVVTRRP